MLTNVAVFGLGKLGAPLVAVLASKGRQVVGVDVNPCAVERLNQGLAPVFEPRLDELCLNFRDRIRATADGAAAVRESEMIFLVVGTPSEPHGGFSMRYVLDTARTIGAAIRGDDRYRLIVLTSTVMPGATAGELLPALEASSGKRCGVDFGLCYNPEFIALGSVIRDMLNPDFLLIGESDRRAGDLLEAHYRSLCDNHPPVARMSFVNAEITKLAVNTFVTTKISYANMLARLCERLPGAEVDVVTRALGLDARIGRHYLRGAIGYGGPCFPRDNRAFASLARQIGAEPALAEATDRFNRAQAASLADIIMTHLPRGGTVGILGLAYKAQTDVSQESAGVCLARELVRRGVPVRGFDPHAAVNAQRELGEAMCLTDTASECVAGSDVVVLTVASEEFTRLAPEHFEGAAKKTIIDCWRVLDQARFAAVTNYVALGVGPRNRQRHEDPSSC